MDNYFMPIGFFGEQTPLKFYDLFNLQRDNNDDSSPEFDNDIASPDE